MSMLVIKGTYRVIGSRPDGDSVRFYPNNPAEWELVPGPVRRNAKGGAQLRLDGIDALETHYATRAGEVHQPPHFAQEAAQMLLRWLCLANVTRDEHDTVTSSVPEQAEGYIYTRGADVHGRCVAFAGRGPSPLTSGERVHVDGAAVEQTANYFQLREGLAYPTFYRKLFPDLRAALIEATARAKSENRGIWQSDLTFSGIKVEGLQALTESATIMPKLFRRLADYLVLNDGDPSMAGFLDYLAERDDRLFIISTGHWTGFDTVVNVTDQTVKLTTPLEDLVFEER
jgi:endonuclease YncB( thermonuclease family)